MDQVFASFRVYCKLFLSGFLGMLWEWKVMLLSSSVTGQIDHPGRSIMKSKARLSRE